MDWTHLVSALWGASFGGLLAWASYRAALEKRLPKVVEDEPVEKNEKDQIDRAFEMLNHQEAEGGGLANNVFPLPQPRNVAQVQILPTKAKAEDRIIKESPGHPCRFLDASTPPHYRAGDCAGMCRHPAQNGRICHWQPNVAKQCSYFDPKVRPRVKLRTIA